MKTEDIQFIKDTFSKCLESTHISRNMASPEAIKLVEDSEKAISMLSTLIDDSKLYEEFKHHFVFTPAISV